MDSVDHSSFPSTALGRQDMRRPQG
ncbi:hypothetical protein TNCV_4823591, partial [Trichonephila clavipes]